GGYGIIQDDDPEPVVSVSDPSVTEGNSGTTPADFTVSITAPSGLDTTVSYTTADGSAVAPGDYTASSGVATIPAGSTSTVVSVPVVGDTAPEGNESFSLTISDPVDATLGTDTASALIVDDDSPPGGGHRVF